MNFCPEIHGTSSLSGSMKILKSFFKDINLKKWNLLAIDALLVLYCLNKDKLFFDNEILTNKSIGNNNLGDKYKIMQANFWKRRLQQIEFWENISNKKIANLDKIICKFIDTII